MKNMTEPMMVAQWFIKRKLDKTTNIRKGNMKLQNLLFFSQLIYMCKNNGATMYEENFSAFDDGMVLDLVEKESIKEVVLPEEVSEALKITENIFGKCTVEELSELSHQFETWSKYLNRSIEDNYFHNKSKTVVPYEELKKELDKMDKVLKAYEKRELNVKEDY